MISTEKLTVYYGRHRGIIDVDLEVEEGEIFGFLGPNGAGKTTTQRVLLDIIRPTSEKRRPSAWIAERTEGKSGNGWDTCRGS